jgi:hypothetical protein
MLMMHSGVGANGTVDSHMETAERRARMKAVIWGSRSLLLMPDCYIFPSVLETLGARAANEI